MSSLLNWFRPRLRLYSFSARLIVGLLLLVILSAVAISVPAQLLLRRQLRAQAWATVRSAQTATESLLQAEVQQLRNNAELLAARPTLLALLNNGSTAELAAYLVNFQTQSDLDFIAVCHALTDADAAAAASDLCATSAASGARLLDGAPVLVTYWPLEAAPATSSVVVGRNLDAALLSALSANTGVAQTIVGRDGTRYAGALTEAASTAGAAQTDNATQGIGQPHEVWLKGRRYFAGLAALPGSSELLSEVALPVEELLRIERRTLLVQAATTLLVASAAALIGALSIRQLVAPLRRLTLVAEAISQGDLMTPIPIFSSPREVSTLATAFHKSQASMLRTLEERSQARDWLNALIQSVVEGVVTLDATGRVTFFSQGAEALAGRSADEALNQPIDAIFTAQDAGAPLAAQLPPPGERQRINVVLPGERRAVLSVTTARLPATHRSPEQTILVLRDVTQEAALQDLRAYFLANVSHEFRTPLSTIQAALEMTLDEAEALSAAEMRELLRPSYLSLVSLRTLIDNLLASSRIEAGQFAIRAHPCDLARVLADSLAIVQPLLDRRRQRLEVSRPPRLPQLEADGARLTQVLVNLLTNASNYSPIGATLGLLLNETAARLTIAVDDRGPGISPAERANLFRRFVRLGNGDREQVGSGLGLYVVKTVVEAHGGQVGVENRPQGGARFTVELPLPETSNR